MKNVIKNNRRSGLINGIVYNEEEEKKLSHDNIKKGKSNFEELFRFPELNE